MEEEKKPLNFIEQIIEEDLANGLSRDKIRFRFPPEPNGYLHIGHTKAICINFGLGEKYNFRRLLIYVRFAIFYHLHSPVIELLKIV